MNILFVHPISCNIALKTLSDDQSSSGTGLMLRLLSILMNSDGSVPDDIEGLIYQTMALIDLQSDEGVEGITEGVDKASTPSRQAIVHTSYLRQMYEQMAKPMAKQYIKMQKTRLWISYASQESRCPDVRSSVRSSCVYVYMLLLRCAIRRELTYSNIVEIIYSIMLYLIKSPLIWMLRKLLLYHMI